MSAAAARRAARCARRWRRAAPAPRRAPAPPRRTCACSRDFCSRGDAELSDEVVDVARIKGLGELGGAPILEEAETLDQESRILLLRLEQLRLLGGEHHRAQPLQRAHRAIAGALERRI